MRPLKQGLDYFPFDVDFFYSDKKIKVLKAKYGCDGITIYIYLLCQIYKNGYYIKLDEDFEYIISDELKMEPDKIGQIINFLCGRSLFDNILFTLDKVLTSPGIQKRFQSAIKERALKRAVQVDGNIWLLSNEDTEAYIKITHFSSKSEKNESKSEKNEGFSTEKVHKEKEIKEEEIKEEEIKLNKTKEMAVVVELYETNIASISPIISEKMEAWLKDVDISLIQYAIEQAVLKNKRCWSYINGVINNCYKSGKKTRAEAETPKEKKANSSKGNYQPDELAALERKLRLERMNRDEKK